MLHRRYFVFTFDSLTLALRASILSVIFSLIYVLYFHDNLNFILAVLGVFVVSIIETIALNFSSFERIKYGLIISVTAGIATGLGSVAGGASIIFLSVGILFFMLLVGISATSSGLPAIIILFIADLFIVGSGMPALPKQAFFFGVSFCLGGLCLVGLSYLQKLLYPSRTQASPLVFSKDKLFTFSSSNCKYVLKLMVAVCGANVISWYLKLPQKYCAPMTALLILKVDHDLAWTRVSHRLFGTLFGSILAGVVLLFVQDQLLLALLILPVTFLIVVSLAKHYGAYVFFVTIMISLLFNLIAHHGIETTWERILSTLLGVVTVVVTLYLSSKLKLTLR